MTKQTSMNALLSICVKLAKASNPALGTVSKACIHSEPLQAPFATLQPGDLCIFSWKSETGRYVGQAGELYCATEEELVFKQVGNVNGHTWRMWRDTPGLAITRVVVVAAPELDGLQINPSNRQLHNSVASLSKRLLAARKRGL